MKYIVSKGNNGADAHSQGTVANDIPFIAVGDCVRGRHDLKKVRPQRAKKLRKNEDAILERQGRRCSVGIQGDEMLMPVKIPEGG